MKRQVDSTHAVDDVVAVVILVNTNMTFKPLQRSSLLMFLLLFLSFVSSLELRRSILTTWTPPLSTSSSSSTASKQQQQLFPPKILGWTLERRDSVLKQYNVTVAWSYREENDDESKRPTTTTSSEPTTTTTTTTTLVLPYQDQPGSLASSLWPAALAGAILLQSPGWRAQLSKGPNVLELGSGVGLTGLTAAAHQGRVNEDDDDNDASSTSTTLSGATIKHGGGGGGCWLTDYDPEAVDLLQQSIVSNRDLFVVPESTSSTSSSSPEQEQLEPPSPSKLPVVAQRLDWRDPPELQQLVQLPTNDDNPIDNNTVEDPIQVVLGTDVCYYYHLLRPLMDTIQRKLFTNKTPSGDDNHNHNNNNDKLVWLVGQANRQSLWDMYHNIGQGCYNQITDEREPAWPGTTLMLLYHLHMGSWETTVVTTSSTTATNQKEEETDDDNVETVPDLASLHPLDGIVPMAALLHITTDYKENAAESSSFSLLGRPYDHVASQADEDAQMKSF